MAKGSRGRRGIASRQCRPTPYPMVNQKKDIWDGTNGERYSHVMHKKDWIDATCSVCMEYPHNAVLLLCSSHEKGCRPYMCGTSCRYSNCLDQYKKAYTKVTSPNHIQPLPGTLYSSDLDQLSGRPHEKCAEATNLVCPLCRGQVKGWTVVEPARAYLNGKKRTCMEEKCLFVGSYKELRKHVKSEHPSARPREVDPALEQKWKRLEREREREDVISTVMSSMPGSVVYGDYVIERGPSVFDSDDDDDDEEETDMGALRRNVEEFDVGLGGNLANMFLLFHAFAPGGNISSLGGMRRHGDGGDSDGGVGGDGRSLVSRLRRQGRVILGRSGRRRRHRDANGEHM